MFRVDFWIVICCTKWLLFCGFQKMVGDLPRQWLTTLNAYGSSSVTAASPLTPDAAVLPLFTDSSMPRHRQWYLMARSVHVSSPVAAAPPPPMEEYVGWCYSLRLLSH